MIYSAYDLNKQGDFQKGKVQVWPVTRLSREAHMYQGQCLHCLKTHHSKGSADSPGM